MRVHTEFIPSCPTRSLRLLHWEASLADVRESVSPGEDVAIDGAGRRWHAHPWTELTAVSAGSGLRFVGDHVGEVTAPELVLMSGGLPHYWRGLDPSRGAAVQFDPADPRGLGALAEAESLRPLWADARRGLLFTGELAREAHGQLEAMAAAGPLARVAALLETLGWLNAHRDGATPLSDKPFALASGAPHAEAVGKAIEVLVDHHAEPITLDNVAEAAGLSRATLCRRFRRYTGKTVVEFLNGVGIDHAKRKLIESDRSVSAIALEAGFANLSHFNRRFLREVGVTPTAYRRASTLS